MKEKVAETKIPKIGDVVYTLSQFDEGCISKETVGFVGKESFVLDNFQDYNLDEVEQFYNDYNSTWFTSLAKAKKAALEEMREHKGGGRWKIVDYGYGCWCAEEY